MKKFLWRFHRQVILRTVNFWYSRWGEKSFLIVLSLAIGALAAVAAAALHALVVQLELLGIQLRDFSNRLHEYAWLLVVFCLPMFGLLLSFLVQRWFGGQRYAKSLSPLILALNRRRTNIPLSETVTHLISSAFSVGFGGSAGLEAPSVLTGAAIGANAGSFFHIHRRLRSLLLGCGSAAAISAIFGSPIAGVLFAAEVLLPEFSVSALVPMMMSSAVAAVVSHLIIADNQFILAINAPWRTDAIPCYFLCGIVCALVGVYVIRAAYWTAGLLKNKLRNPWQRLWVGGSILCIILLLFPVLSGQGYLFIEKLFAGDGDGLVAASTLLSWLPSNTLTLLLLLGVVILLKVVASVLTVDAGGDGGIFAPSMFIGAFTGFAFARLVNLTGLIQLQEYNFVAVGMCGVFTAVLRAPLTRIFLIAEVTGGYILFVPLMIVSSVAFLVARFFEPHSIYRKALVENNLLDDDRDQLLLRRLPVRPSINRQYHALRQNDQLHKVISVVEDTPDETFPVLDDDGRLIGVVYLDKIMSAMLHPEVYNHLLVFDLMEEPPTVMTPDDDLAHAMAAFDMFRLKTLPVCERDGRFAGFLSRAPIFAKYRDMVKESDSF